MYESLNPEEFKLIKQKTSIHKLTYVKKTKKILIMNISATVIYDKLFLYQKIAEAVPYINKEVYQLTQYFL
ncbi:protein of unknown function (DUF749) [Snodgrassella alvi SCGC AB-598-O11]|nr:protein of unknown function (DUF749) [Snodgrassella alvi SCGC AB-598-O11]